MPKTEKKARRTSAVEILHHQYVGNNGEQRASLQEEGVTAQVAQTVYDLRKEARLTQELADLVRCRCLISLISAILSILPVATLEPTALPYASFLCLDSSTLPNISSYPQTLKNPSPGKPF